jgi:ABC-type transport system involved in multi-copper enzyme maturation permease subunit
MTFLPIAERELRIRARRRGTFALRCVAAGLALTLCGLLLILGAMSPGRAGTTAFNLLVTLTFLYCLYEGLRNTADCLSEEKRAGTLGFLFLTDLKGYDVVFGKVLATSLSSFYALLAILPAIGMPVLVGGVTAGEFWRAVLVLVVTLFFSLSTGMLVSSASRSEGRAWSVSVAIIFFLALVPPLLHWTPFIQVGLLSWASPSVAFWTIDQASYTAQPGTFWAAVGGVHALSWAFLGAASVILPRSWQQRELRPRQRAMVPMDTARRRLLLQQNPMLWLASRAERIKVYLWALVSLFGAGFFAIWAVTGFSAAVLAAFPFFILALHFLIASRVAFHVCHTFVDARDSGLLELLLSTPLGSKEILDGFRAAFKRLFGGPVILLLWVEGAVVAYYFWISGQSGDLWLGLVMLVAVGALATAFVMDVHAVATYGMWVSLTAKKPSQAFNKTMMNVLLLPLGFGILCCSGAYPLVAILKNLSFFSYATPLYSDFRKIITERHSSAVLRPK